MKLLNVDKIVFHLRGVVYVEPGLHTSLTCIRTVMLRCRIQESSGNTSGKH